MPRPIDTVTVKWQNYPLSEYADKSTTNLKSLFAAEPADEQPADVESTKNAFLALTQGSTSPGGVEWQTSAKRQCGVGQQIDHECHGARHNAARALGA